MIILCREVDKDTGKIAVYTINKPITHELLHNLRIRAIVNTELRYFCVLQSRWDEEGAEYERMLRRGQVTHRMIEAIGGIAEI